MQNKEICEEKSVKEKNVEIFNCYFPGCLSIENDNKLTLDVGRLKALLGDFSEIKEEGYGLDFVGKKIALNQAFKKNNKILKPLNESTSKHILIKGDNLDALKILRQSYSEKIKMIYIDPPYNTKNDNFIYSDDFSQSNEEVLKTLDYSKEKLDYIKNLFGSKCHSGWLSFMYPRLLLAKDLLKQDGVIFISIDDNECAQLKLLCDEIFGERNFVGQIVRATGTSTGQDSNRFGCSYDMCLCYAKNKEKFNLKGISLNDKDIKRFKYDDNDGKGKYAFLQLRKTGNNDKKEDREKMFYPITAPNGSRVFPLGPKNAYLSCWRVGYSTYKKWEKENLIVWKTDESVVDVLESDDFIENDEIKNDLDYSTHEYKEIDLEKYSSKYKPYVKYYLKGRTKAVSDLWVDIEGNKKGSIEIKNLFEKNAIFSNPKPLDFLNRIIEIATNEGDIILDFFAGSGTTAHAVLESNKSDYQKLSEGGGGLFNGLNAAFKERRFILVQLDEKIDPKKNKSAHDFCLNALKSPSPSIFDITEERIKRAGAKIKEACPYLDVGFRAFEIIDDETNDKNLNEATQKDLFAYSNPKKRETQTILIKLLCCESLELTTPIICLIENALYLALNTAFIVGDIEMSEVLENLKDKGVEKISVYMPAISNDRLCLELGSNLLDLKLESGDLKIRG